MQLDSMTNSMQGVSPMCVCAGTCGFSCGGGCLGCKGTCADSCTGRLMLHWGS